MADSVTSGKFIIPTGYESERLKIALKRRIAQALLERGLSPSGNMKSPLEALGVLAQAFAGKRLENKTVDMETELGERIRGDYQGKLSRLNADIASNMSPEELVRKWQSEPMVEDALKPYMDAIGYKIKERENIVHTPTGYRRAGDVVDKPEFDPNASVIPDAEGRNFIVNPVKTAASLYAQGIPSNERGTIPAAESMPIPGASPQAPATAQQSPGVVSPSASGDIDLSLLNPEERQILENEIKRRGSLPPSNQMPFGNPLSPPPSGMANGKPYWMINGVPYDNPEGK